MMKGMESMDREEHDGLAGLAHTRGLVQGLRGLSAVTAPRSVLAAVLVRTGVGDAYWPLDTPLGPAYVAYNAVGVSAVLRAEDRDVDAVEREFRTRFGRPARPVAAPPPDLARAVTARLHGDTRAPLRFDLRSVSPFGRAVLLKALEIPRGEVRPYAWIAREIGHPRAVRAVGTALGHNPIPLLIPCHRVVRSDGHVGNYAFGRAAKEAVLMAEGVDPATLERLADAGVRYVGSDTTHIFCLPTCHQAQRITERHRVAFPSALAALAAGYRPCRVCRPASIS